MKEACARSKLEYFLENLQREYKGTLRRKEKKMFAVGSSLRALKRSSRLRRVLLDASNYRSASTLGNYSILDENNIVRCTREVEYPESKTLFDVLVQSKNSSEDYSNRIAFIDGVTKKATTFSQLYADSNNLSKFFVENGFAKDDIFAIHTPNSPEYATAILGTLGMGAGLSPANPLYTVNELNYQMTQGNAKVLFTNAGLLSKAKEVAENVGLRKLIVVDDYESNDSDIVCLRDITDGNPDPGSIYLPYGDVSNDVVFLPYSSGTTGLPKGVMLTHNNIISQLDQLNHAFGDGPPMNLAVLPFFHIYGLVAVCLLKIMNGLTSVTVPKFDPALFLQIIQDYKVQKMSLVPPLILFLLKHPMVDQYDLSSLQHITIGAAPCDQLTVDAFLAKFPNISVVQQAYGSTETSPGSHCQQLIREHQVAGSIGPVVPGTEACIRDLETDQNLGPHQEGELLVRGPQVMKGYLNNPEANAKTLTSDGWYRSGDISYFDENHNFFIVDRLKELIKFKGFQVAPAELEALLLTHDSVADCAVIGIPDERAGEVPMAFVVKKLGHELSIEQLHKLVDENVADYKRLRGGIVFLDEIPKSLSGKILRRVLKDRFQSGEFNHINLGR